MKAASEDRPSVARPLRSLGPGVAATALMLLLLGAWLRGNSQGSLVSPGPDEIFYANYYTKNVATRGLAVLPTLFRDYIGYMEQPGRQLVLPPGRLTFTLHSAVLSRLGVGTHLDAVRKAAYHGSVAFLLMGALFLLRWFPSPVALPALAWLACAPLQIHLAHRALIDGYFAAIGLACLWALWESVQPGAHRGWSAALAGSVAALVLTKENSVFLLAALGAGLLWLQLCEGWRHRRFWEAWAALALGALLAAGVLIAAAGDVATLVTAYRLNVQKSYTHPYAILTGDGPLHRYLLDLLCVNPAVTLLALGGLWEFRADPQRPRGYLVRFLALSWIAMSSVRYAMNLRYGLVWDLPLCLLAALLVERWVRTLVSSERRRAWMLAAVTTAVAASSLSAYATLFAGRHIYDPVPEALTRAWRILKS